MKKILLGVNIDHIATIRNVRMTSFPDPVQAAFIAEQSGADSITVHLREDRRHISDRDVHLLRQTIKNKMNLEISAKEEMIDIACNILPDSCCLVPEKREEITTEGGLNLLEDSRNIYIISKKLKSYGIYVSLFIDPEKNQIEEAKKIGISCIEINTGKYASSNNEISKNEEFIRIKKSVEYAYSLNMQVNAGHGLNFSNVYYIARLSEIKELNIGHAIISQSMMIGLSKAIKNMKKILFMARI